jgi:hypothetical protein
VGQDQDDSLTSMEWLPEVSIPYMQQVRCKISQDDIKKLPRKRNRNLTGTGESELDVLAYFLKICFNDLSLIPLSLSILFLF